MRLRSLFPVTLLSLCIGGPACSTSQTQGDRKAAGSMDAPSLFAESLMEQGTVSFKKGAFAAAISSWSEAARLFEEGGNAGKYVEPLTNLSQAYQGIGQHQDALKTIEKALFLAQKERDERPTAEA